MAICTISHSPFPTWFLGSTLHSKRRQQQQLIFGIRKPIREQLSVAVCASSVNKIRSGKKLLTDSELRFELHQFVSAHQLPENHVPSFNELAQGGRKDLAFIVRRRGYKHIRELLESSDEMVVNELEVGESPIRKKVVPNGYDVNEENGQRENVQGLVGLTAEAAMVNSYGSILGTRPDVGTDEQRSVSTVLLLQEKVANFIQSGELEYFEDENNLYDGIKEGKSYSELDNASPTGPETESEELSENKLGDANDTLLNGRASKDVEGPTEGILIREKYLSTEEHIGDDSGNDLDSKIQEGENEAQISHLKFMLHQKELELSQLKEQIEKEKLQLSIVQNKAETEIGKAQKTISEKDEELSAAEDSLAGLKEVQIQYCVDGETVEVSGSFNGWHHRIKMDPDASAVVDPMEPRKPLLWSATLWLYPGVYEIKFIVDGQWTTDPQRESVIKGTINNNILRVER